MCSGGHYGQIPGGFALRGAPGSSVGVELEERVRRRRENYTGDQRRVAKKKAPHRPSGTDRRSIRFGPKFVYAHGTSKKQSREHREL